MIVVSDSSPLVSFAILRKLSILDAIFDDLYIPNAVFQEITQRKKQHSEELKSFTKNRVKYVQNTLAVQILQRELDAGEAEAMVLAIENNISDILIDEYKGRRIAKANGLSPKGISLFGVF